MAAQFTQADLISYAEDFLHVNGRPPTLYDWEGGYEKTGWPSRQQVQRAFGNWTKFMRAANL